MSQQVIHQVFKPPKPWLSYKAQLAQLRERGLQVEDEAAALNYLARLGYYRLSGYWYPMREVDQQASAQQGKAVRSDRFVPGSHFQSVVQLYVFDKKLRLLALDALERIEMAVRVDVAHVLGKRDPLAHLKPEHLHGNFTKKVIAKGAGAGKTMHQMWLERFQQLQSQARKQPFVQHHLQAYGALPVWAAVEVWDFGLLSKLFAGMKYEDQQTIAHRYGAVDGKAFGQWLRSLNMIRNVAAHHARLWNLNVLELSPLPAGWPTQLKPARPFFYFCLMQHLLGRICPNSTWGERLMQVFRDDFPQTMQGVLNLSDFGLYPRWEGDFLWRRSQSHK